MITLPSLGKLVLLAAVLVVVWWVFWRTRTSIGGARSRNRRDGRLAKRKAEALELKPCVRCHHYVEFNSARACGRADCPFA